MPSALVLGSAACVFADAENALKLFTPDAIGATNNIGKDWDGHVDYWFTLHIQPHTNWVGMKEARRRRKAEGRNDPQTWAHKPGPAIDFHASDWGGSTGLLAVKILLEELHFDKIVLAGVPMTPEHAHYNDKHEWAQAPRYRRGWEKHKGEIAPHVRSMSGWTQDLLGAPTPEWLAH